jgi:hypothetical protein
VTEPLVSGVNAALMLVWMFLSVGGLVAIAGVEIYRAWRARRNDDQVRFERRLRRGMKLAHRKGWLPEEYKGRLARFNEDTQ